MKHKYRFAVIMLILGAIALSACSGPAGPQVKAEDPWIRAAAAINMDTGSNDSDSQDQEMTSGEGMSGSMGGANSAAYMIIHNNGNEADKLLKAEGDIADAVEIHVSEMVDGVMSMHPVDGVDIPAKGQAELKPGSYHIMLIGIKRDLNEGEKVNLKLTFEKSGSMDIEAEVRMP